MADAVSIELLRELLDYNPVTGKLWWKERDRRHFLNDLQWKAWNARWAGKEAFTAMTAGYRSGRIFGKFYFAHAAAFAIHNGRWAAMIDHKDQDKLNNRADNLRETTRSKNGQNAKLQDRNKSGCPGVRLVNGSWQARITHEGNVIHIGSFGKNLGAAITARRAKEAGLGFSPLHGRLK